MLWTNVTIFSLGIGIANLVQDGVLIESLEIHIDDKTLTPETRNVISELTTVYIPNGVRTVLRDTLIKSGRPVSHISGKSFPVTVDMRGDPPGKYAADYLCSIVFRALDTFDLRRYDTRWLNRLQEHYPEMLFADVTAIMAAKKVTDIQSMDRKKSP